MRGGEAEFGDVRVKAGNSQEDEKEQTYGKQILVGPPRGASKRRVLVSPVYCI